MPASVQFETTVCARVKPVQSASEWWALDAAGQVVVLVLKTDQRSDNICNVKGRERYLLTLPPALLYEKISISKTPKHILVID